MHRNQLKVKIMSVDNVQKMRKIYLYDKVSYETLLRIPYYKKLGSLEVVNITTVDHHGQWGIVNQSGKSARADFTE